MEFRLLGPLEVAEHERVLDLGVGKQRALFAILLLHANAVVSNARLIDELWPEGAPRTAAKSIQVYVSGLRKQLGDGRLVTRKPGYILQVGRSELDVTRFERLLDEARGADPERAAALLREALGLWRGSPLADLGDERFAQPEIARLEGLRLAAIEQRIDAELASGRDAELVGELEALVAEHPLRERPRRQLMLALYGAGRDAEALAVYRATRRALVEQLGIEPSAELRRIEHAILVRDPSIALGTRAPARSAGTFVGRGRELAELLAALDDAVARRGRLVLIAGEPGIGKSRLIEELGAHASARGAQVLAGRCWEAGGAPAYWPWIQALRALMPETGSDALATRLGAAAEDLAPLLPEGRAPAQLESEGARFRLLEAATSLLRLAAQDQPLVLVLDDLHAADEASLLLLQFAGRSIGDSRMLVVGAYRDVAPAPRDPLATAVAQLLREPSTALITLTGLSPGEVTEYIALATAVVPAATLAGTIHARTEGNPLFVVEAVRLLEAEGRIADAAAELRIPPGVRAVIGQRIGRLSERCRELLVAASVIGRDFGLDAMRRLSELPSDALLDVLDEAMAERVIEDVPGAHGRLRFAHALIRDTLYDELTPARKLGLHRRTGEALESVYASDPGPHLAELARHFIAAAPAGTADKAIDYARRAGDRAASQLAYEEAARLYEESLALVEVDESRCDLLLAVGDARARAGDAAGSKRAFSEAADVAERRGLDEHLARAALGYGGRLIWDKVRDDDEQFVSLIERALAALGDRDSPLRVRLVIRLVCGPIAGDVYPWERRAALSREALEMARRIGDPETLAFAIDGYLPVVESPANTRELLEQSTELLRIATEVGDDERVFDAHNHRLERLFELGEMARASAELEAMVKLAERLRQPTQRLLATVCRARLALHEGRVADAAELIAEGRAVGERTQVADAQLTFAFRLQSYVLEREHGRLDEAARRVRRSIEEYPDRPIWRCALAEVEAELAHETDARNTLEALAADGFTGLPFDDSWLVSMGLLAEAAGTLGDAQHASVLYARLLPYADRVAVTYSEISIGSVARYLGLLAATTGRRREAARHFEAAVEMNERIGARPWLARTRRDYGRMLGSNAAPPAGPAAGGSSSSPAASRRRLR